MVIFEGMQNQWGWVDDEVEGWDEDDDPLSRIWGTDPGGWYGRGRTDGHHPKFGSIPQNPQNFIWGTAAGGGIVLIILLFAFIIHPHYSNSPLPLLFFFLSVLSSHLLPLLFTLSLSIVHSYSYSSYHSTLHLSSYSCSPHYFPLPSCCCCCCCCSSPYLSL